MQEEFKKRYYCSEPHSQNRLCEALLLLMMASRHIHVHKYTLSCKHESYIYEHVHGSEQ